MRRPAPNKEPNTLLNASGEDDDGAPYVNLTGAVPRGGLAAGAASDPVLVEFDNPDRVRFALRPEVLVGGPNNPPAIGAIAPLSVMPGGFLEVPVAVSDSDGDFVSLSIAAPGGLPTGGLLEDVLRFQPAPGEEGVYNFTLLADDGAARSTRDVLLTVAPDPIGTTRVSGVVQNIDGEPLADVPITAGADAAVTGADGAFLLELTGSPPADTLLIHGEQTPGPDPYPFIAEKLHLLLGHPLYENVNNVVGRPIFLPVLDVAGGATIDPDNDTTVSVPLVPGEAPAAVFVAAGTLMDQQGGFFDGVLSITEVPPERTPAALPPDLSPQVVVTIQPAEMVFTTPAPLTLPNREGFPPGTLMDLWSINPVTGEFDLVGAGVVTADGALIETISGGILNSSWHAFDPSPSMARTRAEPHGCPVCPATAPWANEVELYTGGVVELHALPAYRILERDFGAALRYDSRWADLRPIVRFGFTEIPAWVANFDSRLIGELTVRLGDFAYTHPGASLADLGVPGDWHFWSLPPAGGDIEAALQLEIPDPATGVYDYTVRTGFLFRGNVGSTVMADGELAIVNRADGPFGAGWSLEGFQEIVEHPDGKLLLIDGDGTTLVFEPPPTAGEPFVSPAGDFATLRRLADGRFERTLPDQTVYTFTAADRLESVRDRHGNQTTYNYDAMGRLVSITDPVGQETTFGYAGDRVETITDPAGRVTQLDYDAAGNLMRITDADGSTRQFQYDSRRLLTGETDRRGGMIQRQYGFHGRAERVVLPDGAEMFIEPYATTGLYRPEQTTDRDAPPPAVALSNPTASYVDAAGDLAEFTLSDDGQLVSMTDVIGEGPLRRYNAQKLVSDITNTRGATTFFDYDDRGNLIRVLDLISVEGGGLGALSRPGQGDVYTFSGSP
ncbi:MAG: hypothetical protein KY475_21415, partial [Planctomycetes bacterium]|nr:hypothetical protein [Planctomycetota bacterium]